MAPLARQNVPVTLGARDGKKSSKLSVPGTLTTLENYIQTEENKYRRRCGTTRLDALAASSGTPQSLVGIRGQQELIAITDTNAWARTTAAPISFQNAGSTVSYMPTVHDLGVVGTQVDSLVVDNKMFIVYENSTVTSAPKLYLSIFEIGTGKSILRDYLLKTGLTSDELRPRIVATTNYVSIFYKADNAGTTTIYARTINRATPTTVGAAVSIGTFGGSVPALPFDVQSRDEMFDLVYANGSAGVLNFYQYDPATSTVYSRGGAGTAQWTILAMSGITATGQNQISYLSHDFSDGYMYIAVTHAGTSPSANSLCVTVVAVELNVAVQPIGVLVLDYLLGTGSAANTQFRNVLGWVDPTTLLVTVLAEVYDTTLAIYTNHIVKSNYTRSTGTVTPSLGGSPPTPFAQQLGLASRSWKYGSSYYALANYASAGTQNKMAVINLSTFAIMTVVFDGIGAGHAGIGKTTTNMTQGRLPAVYTPDSGATVYLVASTVTSAADVQMLKVEAAPANIGHAKEVTDAVIIPGGVTRICDGESTSELAFHLFPETPVLTTSAGGNFPGAVTYRLRTVFVWKDAHGREYFSGPSVSQSVAPAVNTKLTVTQPVLSLTDKLGVLGTHVRIEIYMTAATPGTNPPYYYQSAITNDPTAATVLTDISTPTTTGRELYVLGDESVLENTPAAAFRAVEVFGGRAWGLSANNRAQVWPSKLIEEGLGVAFEDSVLPVLVEDGYGDLTAISSVDDKTILFKRNAVYAVWGGGPDNTGNGTFSDPFLLPTNIGTTSPHVFRTSLGVVYRGSDDTGFWLVDRNLSVTFIGSPIDDLKSFTVTDINVAPAQNQIRVALSDGRVFCYDLVFSRWYIFTGWSTNACTLFGGKYTFIDSSGVVRYEDTTKWTDDGTNYKAVWETSWISPSGIAGYNRVYQFDLIGDYLGQHGQYVRAFFDYGVVEAAWKFDTTGLYTVDYWGDGTVYGDRLAWGGNRAGGGAQPDGRYHIRCKLPLKRQRAHAIKIRAEEYYPETNPTAGFAFEEIVLDCGMRPGLARLPPAYKATTG